MCTSHSDDAYGKIKTLIVRVDHRLARSSIYSVLTWLSSVILAGILKTPMCWIGAVSIVTEMRDDVVG